MVCGCVFIHATKWYLQTIEQFFVFRRWRKIPDIRVLSPLVYLRTSVWAVSGLHSQRFTLFLLRQRQKSLIYVIS